ncbi:hypothetical protein SIL77_08115 [Exiguobacterium profundum]|uniref:hypothetical protein n=1 Tax=Exiguobacterium profundum TaxID=307643 RepID=UPI0029C2A02F|nr:hypothetical protein [Exiguobacterium profundum]MDX5981223.1 hypothetical protein [Exiguobacterium profundum]
MGKLSFLLAEDYIKPKIYFKSKQVPTMDTMYTSEDHNNFSGLEHLTQLLSSPRGFIVNAFQIDYYQSLPRLIARSLNHIHSFKKLYILGPELSLSILKRSTKTIYEKQLLDYEYINVEQDSDFVTNQCMILLEEGHILYILPETSVCWRPNLLNETDKISHSLCSTLLSQQVNVSILATAVKSESEKVVIFPADTPDAYSGDLETRIYQQSETLYRLFDSLKADE